SKRDWSSDVCSSDLKGDGTLELVDGPLLQHAKLAREYPDLDFVLVIEEFNRGNPAQALGEMLTLLEHTKRTESEALELTYKHDRSEERRVGEQRGGR